MRSFSRPGYYGPARTRQNLALRAPTQEAPAILIEQDGNGLKTDARVPGTP